MKISITTTQKVTTEKEILPMTFYKSKGLWLCYYFGIYDEERVIKIAASDTYSSVSKLQLAALYNSEELAAGENITELEFSEKLAECLCQILDKEVCLEEKELQPA